MTNDEQQQTYAMLARNHLKAAEAARRPSFDDFHRAHQAKWAAGQALTGDETALAEVIVGMAEEVALLQEAHAALLAAHAEALEREARIMGHFQAAHDALQRRADESRIDFNIAARVVEAQLEAAKLNLPTPPAQAPASAEGGAE